MKLTNRVILSEPSGEATDAKKEIRRLETMRKQKRQRIGTLRDEVACIDVNLFKWQAYLKDKEQ